MTSLARADILTLIPHAGTMCLLDEVLHWDEISVRCRSQRFAQADNPLRRAGGTLGTATGIEIAAQAMAVHGRLTALAETAQDAAPRPGYLVALRDVQLARAALDASGPLTIEATRLRGDSTGATYNFTLTADGEEKLRGRATVLFGAPS